MKLTIKYESGGVHFSMKHFSKDLISFKKKIRYTYGTKIASLWFRSLLVVLHYHFHMPNYCDSHNHFHMPNYCDSHKDFSGTQKELHTHNWPGPNTDVNVTLIVPLYKEISYSTILQAHIIVPSKGKSTHHLD